MVVVFYYSQLHNSVYENIGTIKETKILYIVCKSFFKNNNVSNVSCSKLVEIV